MSPIDQENVDYGRSKAQQSFFSKGKEMQPGQSVKLKIVDVEMNRNTKYPIQGKDFCYRFVLGDGRVWDEATSGIFGALIKLCYPDGKTFRPTEITLTRLVSKPTRGSQYKVEKT